MLTDAPVDDIVELLEEDHRLVENRFGELATAGPSTRGELFWKLTSDLVRHEVAEEVAVYPALRDVPGGDTVADARIAEQSLAEERLAEMEKMDAASTEFASALASLEEVVLAHARAEEETAFALLLSGVAASARVELGLRYMKAKDAAPTHPHPHVPDTPPGNLVLGPVAALVDRIRDAASAV